MFINVNLSILFLSTILTLITCDSHSGPDPWDIRKVDLSAEGKTFPDAPPDLLIPLKKKTSNSNLRSGEWFFKRVLAIILNAGQTKVSDDGSVDISLQMKLDPEKWQTLNEYTKSNIALTEEMFRRSIAYIEGAIYKPSLPEQIAMAWSEYIQMFLVAYKNYIVCGFGALAVVGALFLLWRHMSYKYVIILLLIGLYLYEVIISYKEAEKEDLDKFLSAVNKCSWYFWKSSCEVPAPDPIAFMKHMSPLKIGLRMFTTFLSEPMIILSSTANTIVKDITGQLWFPFDVILHSFLVICINITVIVLLIMIMSNYILNIPFNLNILRIVRIGFSKDNSTTNRSCSRNHNSQPVENVERISSETLHRILDVVSRALPAPTQITPNTQTAISNDIPKLKRSSSTGRLPSSSFEKYSISPSETVSRNTGTFMIGGGDNSQVSFRDRDNQPLYSKPNKGSHRKKQN